MVKRNYRSNMDPRSNLGIRPKIGQCDGSSRGVRYDFTECIGKIARNMMGDRQRRIVILATRNVGGYRIVGVRPLSLVVMYDCNP
ncbi:hypothetical protein BHM03_00062312 [Ensete ventricosum]|nr:hypothetical protein BHM03_00062312 [Ensete ventricosum]